MNRLITRIRQYFKRPTTQRGGVTVRFMFPIFAGFLAILSANVLTSVDTSYIKLSPSKNTVMNGEIFALGIYAYAHVPVNAIDIAVSFDADSVEILSIDKGQSVLTIWTQEPTIKPGLIELSGGTFRRGFVGEHLIATVKIMAKKDGRTELFVKDAELLAGDGKGTAVELARNDTGTASFIIYAQGVDPTTLEAQVDFSITADIDGDGIVTLKDISSFMASWYRGEGKYDFNNDQKMNFIDFSIILARSFYRSSN